MTGRKQYLKILKFLMLALVSLSGFYYEAEGQSKQGDNWFFGHHAGVKFVNGSPQGVSGGQTTATNNLEGTATISDSNGNLLFYTDGQTVWNKTHQVMATGLMGHSSATQSGVIVQAPGSKDTFYIFTIDATQNNLNNGLRYTMIDMQLNSGLGGVITGKKNVLLTPSGVKMAEKITAVRHCNNRDIWVIAHDFKIGSSTAGNKFYAYLVTPSGISSPVVTTIGTVHQGGDNYGYGSSRGYMKASSDGRRIALAIGYDGCGNVASAVSCPDSSGAFEIYDFNYTTGVVSNMIRLKNKYKGAYGIEFSANGDILYGTTWGVYGSTANPEYNRVYQWNLNAGSQTAIRNSEKIIASESASSGGNYGALQMASNQKIYIARDNKGYLSVINYPNKLGTSCNYQQVGVTLNTGASSQMGLPTFVQSYFNPNLGFSYIGNFEDMVTQFVIADSMRIDSVRWFFDDTCAGQPHTSTSFNPSYTYCDTGNYRVRLIIWKCNTVDTIEHIVVIHPRPRAKFTTDSIQCFNENRFKFINNSTIASGTINWHHWDFGDGDTSDLKEPVHVYAKPGKYTVKLVEISDYGGYDSTTMQVYIKHSPKAEFYVDEYSRCLTGNSFLLDNNSSIGSTSTLTYKWYFGNGDSSTKISPDPYSFSYSDSFKVTLIVKSDSNCWDTTYNTIYVRPMPAASFQVNDSTQCLSGNKFIFTENSTISYGTLSYRWQFGDNDSTTLQNPQHSYNSADTFTVRLIVTSNYQCRDTVFHKNIVFPMPDAQFSINDSTQCLRGNQFTFNNNSTLSSGTMSYEWHFGDGDTSTSKNVQHSYLNHDTFSVKLYAISAFGCKDSLTLRTYVFPMPLAGFSIADSDQCLTGNNFSFTNQTSIYYGTLSYLWNFGDGATSTIIHPSHTYNTSGTKNIELIATSNQGCKDTTQKSVMVYPMPVSNFLINESSQCLTGNQFSFTDTSSYSGGSIVAWEWYFGDGDSALTRHSSHQYVLPDTFWVKHIVSSNTGCNDTLIKSVIVKPNPLDLHETPYLSSLKKGLVAYYPFEGNANDLSGNNRTANVYGASQTTGIIGNAYSFNGSNNYIERPPDTGFIPGTRSWTISTWFKTGGASGNNRMLLFWYRCGANPSCGSNDGAEYALMLNTADYLLFYVRDDNMGTGAAKTLTSPFTVADNQWHLATGVLDTYKDTMYFYIDNCCIAKMYYNSAALTSGLVNVPFEIGRTYKTGWGSPDNYFSGLLDEVRVYHRALNPKEVFALYYMGKQPEISLKDQKVCKSDSTYIQIIHPQFGINYQLINALTNQPVGNAKRNSCGDTLLLSTGSVMDTMYFKISAYDTLTKCLTILDTVLMVSNFPQPLPSFTINDTIQCFNENYFRFYDSSTISSGTLSRLWKLGDNTTSNLANPEHKYDSAANFTVRLISISDYNCRDSVQKTVTVLPSPVMTINMDEITLCEKSATEIKINGALYYRWLENDGILYSSSDSDTVIVSPDTSVLYRIEGKNIYGCPDTIQSKVNVYPLPLVDAGKNDTICYRDTTQLQGSGGLIYSWHPGNSLSDSTIANPKAFPLTTTTYYLTATNPAHELIKNGDFSMGDTLFNSSYIYSSSSLLLEGRYWVGNNPNTVHYAFSSCGDHTSGSGNMMVVNGSTSNNAVIWSQTVNVTKNTDYAFSTWITSVTSSNVAELKFDINGTQIGNLISPSSACCTWSQFYVVWNSGNNTTATISIVNKNTLANGNDYALDDISFAPLCSNIDSVTIVVNPPPIPAFTIDDSTQCFNGNLFHFSNLSTISSGSLKYLWQFGDNKSDTSTNPSHSYNTDDTFVVKLIGISDNNCKDSLTKTVYVFPNPSSSFSINDTTQCFNENNFTFTNQSTIHTGSQTYTWYFGDGTTANSTDATRKYTYDDTFTVRLINVSNLGCMDSSSKTVYVFPSPEPDFSINDSNQCFNGNSFSFTNYSTINSGHFANYWTFGDGDSALTYHTSHSYLSDDTFTVRLLLVSGLGCRDSLSKTVYVFPNPVAEFSVDDSAQCLKNNVFSFTNQTNINSGNVSYQWSFGDGQNNNSVNTSHSYNHHDTFTVKLLATSNLGCTDSAFRQVYVYPMPAALFTVNDSTQCLRGNHFVFTNQSTIDWGTLSYKWYNGDGTTASTQHNTHSFSSDDTLTTSLSVTSAFGCSDSFSRTSIIYPMPVSSYSVNDSTQCLAGNQFTFSNLSSVKWGNLSFFWDFDDGNNSAQTSPSHSYSYVDTFSVRLIATSNVGCKDTSAHIMQTYYMPVSSFGVSTSEQCFANNITHFSNYSSITAGNLTYRWTFGDGAGASNQDTQYSYANPGTYTVKLVSTSEKGCRDSVTKTISIHPMPVAKYAIYDSSQCFEGNAFGFNNLSTIAWGSMTYLWDFGDTTFSVQTKPVHSYSYADTFVVKLVATSDKGCKDSISKITYVHVHPEPVARFYINDSLQCLRGNLFDFTNVSTIKSGTFTSFWDFGDGTSVSAPNSSHSYNNHDTFDVKLLLVSDWGCKDSVIKKVQVFPMPLARFSINDSSQCLLGNHYEFVDRSTIAWGNLSRKWSTGEQHFGSNDSFIVSYSYHDTFDVQLISFSDSGCYDTLVRKVFVHPMPLAGFTVNNQAQCLEGNLFYFTDTTRIAHGSFSNYWTFGDATNSPLKNPSHVYSTYDTFIVRMIATSGLNCRDTFDQQVVVHPMPVAAFSINDSNQCLNQNHFYFTNSSSIPYGQLQYWWYLGDGNFSNLPNPDYRYITEDTNEVKLIVYSQHGCTDSIIKKAYIFPSPKADFLINDSIQCFKGNSFVLTNNTYISSGANNYFWNFGDGNSSVLTSPTHSYATDDTFTVRMIAVSGLNCADTIHKKVYVFPTPVPSFSINNDKQCFNYNSFIFSNNSTINSGQMSYTWNFGDGDSSYSVSPSHSYLNDDTFTVRLIAVSGLGCSDSLDKTVYVYPNPVPAFSINDSQQCFNGNQFAFTNQTLINSGTMNYNWNFGDGAVSTLTHPSHSYSTHDTFLVRLIATSNLGCKDTVSNFVYIFPSPAASFTIANDKQCLLDNRFIFSNNSSIANGNIHFRWFFNDGDTSVLPDPVHSYQNHGNYTVKLIVESDLGCQDSVAHPLEVFPMPLAEFSINDSTQCLRGNNFVFSQLSSIPYGTLTWNWQFGDGQNSSLPSPTHIYSTFDTFTIRMIAVSNNNCRDTAFHSAIVFPMPAARWLVNDSSQCLRGNKFVFTNQSSIPYGSVNYTWDFGDSSASGQNDPTHVYTNHGTYPVRLVAVSLMGCPDSLTKQVFVRPMPKADFTVNDATQCLTGNQFDFTNTSAVANGTMNYSWSFGDGNTSTNTSPSHTYNKDNTYSVRLIAVSQFYNCADTISKNMEVHPMPKADFSFTTPCIGEEVYFTDKSTVGSPAIVSSWFWNFRDGNTSAQQHPAHIFSSPGTFSVRLLAGTNQLCYDSVEKKVVVYPYVDPTIIDRATVVDDKEILLEWLPVATGRPKEFIVEKSSDNINFGIISNLPPDNFNLTDDKVSVDQKSYTYRISVLDSCNYTSEYSNIGKTMLLRADTTATFPVLYWTPYEFWSQGIERYELQAYNNKSKAWENVSDVFASDTFFADSLTLFNQSEYCYRVVAQRNADGQTSTSNEVCLPTPLHIFVPNAFTPNGDGLNDKFEIKGLYILEYEIVIYDRWGNKLFESNDIRNSWDGTYEGKVVPLGPYYFHISVRGTQTQRRFFKGTVMVLR